MLNEAISILIGRLLQATTLLLVNYIYLAKETVEIFVNYNLALAIAPIISLVILFGGYIRTIQEKIGGQRTEIVKLNNMIVIPTLLFVLFHIGLSVLAIEVLLKKIIVLITAYVVLLGMADIYIFEKKYNTYVSIIFSASLFVFLGFIFIGETKDYSSLDYAKYILILYFFVLVVKAKIALNLNKNNPDFINKQAGASFRDSMVIISSSAAVGLLVSSDRILLSMLNQDADNVKYFAGITLAMPINFLAIIFGKIQMMKFYSAAHKIAEDRYSNFMLIGCCIALSLLLIPIQILASEVFLGHSPDTILQFLLNQSFFFLVLSKTPLARLYAARRQLYVTLIHIFSITTFSALIVLSPGKENMIAFLRVACFGLAFGLLVLVSYTSARSHDSD